MDLLLFLLGESYFCFPLSSIKRIVPISPVFTYRGQESKSYYEVDGSVFPYVSLWDLLYIQSRYLEFEELESFLEIRRRDHLDWISALENSVQTGSVFTKSRNPRECAFGKWYYAYTTQHRRLQLLLSCFERPHAVIHALADRLLNLTQAGRNQEALSALSLAKNTTLKELLNTFDSTIQLVVDLQRRLVVIAEHDENYFAIGVDDIVDIINVSASLCFENPMTHSDYFSTFVSFDNGQITPVINLERLTRNFL